ncbi:hypothetical protein [Ruminococcus flavefaciens]|uniref:hypothetical protein n=1 Tax=Ruminococcus flavefaciens TaxID=1265 RepID=UPI0026E9C96A|nr:hypothetical protein [Ruminococcus flavefaciens]
MYNFKSLIQEDIDKIIEEAHFTDEQYNVFKELINPKYGIFYSDTSVYCKLNYSPGKFYRIKSEVIKKCRRIITDI